MSDLHGNDAVLQQFPADFLEAMAARTAPKGKGTRTVRGLPLHQRKLFRNLARQTPRVQGLTFDHNQIRWISYWKNDQNKQVQKHFPVSRFGFFGARQLALEERNRVQGWPRGSDEASDQIAKLKADVAGFDGEVCFNFEDCQLLDIEEERAATQATEAALTRSAREGAGEYERPKTIAASARRRGMRPKSSFRRGVNVATQTDRNAEGEHSDRTCQEPEGKEEQPPGRLARVLGDLSEVEESVRSLKTSRGLQTNMSLCRQMQRIPELPENTCVRTREEENLANAILKCIPQLKAGRPIFLDKASEQPCESKRSSGGQTRLVSLASSVYEPEPLGDSGPACGADPQQEPDVLRDLLNCAVTAPLDTGVDWDEQCRLSGALVDTSRPAKKPIFTDARGHQY